MPTRPLNPELQKQIYELKQQGLTHLKISKRLGVAIGSVHNFSKSPPVGSQPTKKIGKLNWRETIPWLNKGQELRHEASQSQDVADIVLGDGKSPIILGSLSDMHIGSVGADHNLLQQFTDEIIETPDLYVALIGDYAEFAIALRSVAEVCGQILSPDMQMKFVESWLEEIAPKVAWATHDNHMTARSEKNIGVDINARIFGPKVVYHGNIGHTTVRVGEQTYKIASSHRFRGNSMLNPAHACMRYLRMEAPDCEVAMMGDTHVPMAAKYREGNSTRVVINTGNLHLHSSYARRHFSLAKHPYFPCMILWHDRHDITPLWSVSEAVRLLGRGKK